jgi:hypothetical protein
MQLLSFVLTPAFLQLPPLAKVGMSQQRKGAPVVEQHVGSFTLPAIHKYHLIEGKTSALQTAAVAAALSQKLVFAKQRATGSPDVDAKSLDALDEALIAFRLAMLQAYPELCNRVNFLFGRHFREAVRNYGVGALLSVCMEEMLHGLYKHRVILKRSHNLMFTHEHDVINVSTSDFLCSSFITRFQSSVDAQFTWT